MDIRTLDVKASKELYRKNRKLVEAKKCYENVYRLFSKFPRDFSDGTYKVVYGYMDNGIPNVLIRHAFLLNSSGRIVDPTIIASKEKRKEMGLDVNEPWPKYYLMHVFPDLHTYINALVAEEKYALLDTLSSQDKDMLHWAQESGHYLLS